MAKRRWTILVVPQGSGDSREVEFSSGLLKVLGGLASAFVLVAVGLTYTAVTKAIDLSRLERLEEHNQVLAQELDRMATHMVTLADSMGVITDRDRNIRLLAGLAPNDGDVLQAGIGGPPAYNAVDRLLAETELGQRTLAAKDDLQSLIRRAEFLSASFQEAVDTIVEYQDLLTRTPSILPTAGFISSNFSRNRLHPVFGDLRPHEGIDVVAQRGDPIMASAAGRVVQAGEAGGYGLQVVIDHGNGVQTRYAHASQLLVRYGQLVERGDIIAEVGRTGVATNNHLHYEVLVNGQPQNPLRWIFNGRVVD
ncbi:MAG: M23 family metallopeptidase [Gemmatimonadota bacterium]|nr:M23 family metallopeptidase [Gemmatimonadota bacterium]MDH5805995.1 M23 family metallopeptidase [Gemmatimonadota bacterium]